MTRATVPALPRHRPPRRAATGTVRPQSLDISYTGFSAKALDQAGADSWNTPMYCGFADWKPDEERNILDKTCFGFTLQSGSRSFDIYKLDASTVTFGKDAKNAKELVETDRPTVLDPARVFNKK